MSNLMHKVKDALTGHHESETKASSRDSSDATQKVDNTRHGQGDTWGSNTNADPTTTGDYSSKPMGSDSYGTGGYNTGAQRGTTMPGVREETENTYGSTGMGTDTYDSANKAKDYDTGYQSKPIGSGRYDSNPRAGNLGSGMNTGSYGSATQEYGSNPMSTGFGDSPMANKMDSGLDNRATTGTTGQTGAYTSNYGDDLGSTNRYNTRSTAAANMPSQMETRSESEMDKQGLGGGAAAGGSSYNTADAPKRRSSGPHSSNLLNKLDPRVRSSDYEGNAMGNQRGN